LDSIGEFWGGLKGFYRWNALSKTMLNILDNPFFYNLRFVVAGDQKLTKNFIITNYQQFHCQSVLDVGCGTGDFSLLFPSKKYLGIDINKNYIHFARGRYLKYIFLLSDISDYKLKKYFDATLLISVLHHLNNDQAIKILSKICNCTKKIIIVIDLNPKTSLLKKILIKLDRGKFIRNTKEKVALLSQFGKIVKLSDFSTRLASQTGIVLIPNKTK
jgi:ubiquinone/menaquinone biosynthesis C-methylase UbiE